MYGPSYRPNVVCFFTILVFLFCFGSAFAQDNDTPESVDGVLLAVDDSADAPTEDDYDDDDDDKDDKADDSDYDSDDGYSSRRYYQADASVKALETKVKDLEKKLEEQEKDNKIASARAKALAAKMEVLKQETEKSVKESLFDWSLFLAMDVMMAETEADPSGLSIKKASILIEKEVLDGKMQFVLEPEYAYDGAQNDHHARFGTALVDISLLDRNASATEKPASTYEIGFDPLHGRNHDHHVSRYSKSYLGLQFGLQNIPFGVFARYDDPGLMMIPSGDLVSKMSDQSFWDVALRLYGGHDWFVWDSWMARGRMDRWSAGARFGVTPMDRMEFGLSYKCDFRNFSDEERFQDAAAYFMAGVWRMDFLAQFLYQEEARDNGDRLYNTGGNLEARLDADRLYGAARFDMMYMGADKYYWRFTPSIGFWAYPKIFTIRALYQINSEANDDLALIQLMAQY